MVFKLNETNGKKGPYGPFFFHCRDWLSNGNKRSVSYYNFLVFVQSAQNRRVLGTNIRKIPFFPFDARFLSIGEPHSTQTFLLNSTGIIIKMGSRLKLVLFAVFLCFTVSGCSSNPAINHSAVNTLDFTSAADIKLCVIYGYGMNRAEEAGNELRRRNIFLESEWNDIEHGIIMPGMSLCAVYAAFTNISRKYSEKKDAQGDAVKEIIYDCRDGRVPFCPFTQVTIKNDKVTEVKQLNSL